MFKLVEEDFAILTKLDNGKRNGLILTVVCWVIQEAEYACEVQMAPSGNLALQEQLEGLRQKEKTLVLVRQASFG